MFCGNNAYNPSLEVHSPRNSMQFSGMLGSEARVAVQHQSAKFPELTPENSMPCNPWEQTHMITVYGGAPPYASPAFCCRNPPVGQSPSSYGEPNPSIPSIQDHGAIINSPSTPLYRGPWAQQTQRHNELEFGLSNVGGKHNVDRAYAENYAEMRGRDPRSRDYALNGE